MLLKFDNIILQDIVLESQEETLLLENFLLKENSEQECTHIRVAMPSNFEKAQIMLEKRYFFADRTIKTSINLNKNPFDLQKCIRIPIEETNEHNSVLLQIALDSFTYDSRFHITKKRDKNITKAILTTYFESFSRSLVALYKEQVVGFLNLKPISEKSIAIHLAAVCEQQRNTGAGMTLYSKAFLLAQERGYKTLEGRISSQNMPVMNIYALFGAKFSAPMDIFIKES